MQDGLHDTQTKGNVLAEQMKGVEDNMVRMTFPSLLTFCPPYTGVSKSSARSCKRSAGRRLTVRRTRPN